MPASIYEGQVFEQRPRLKEACIKLDEMARALGVEAKLPTMLQLRSQLGISVQILNDAVRELERREVLRTVNGVGIYVAGAGRRARTGNIGFITDLNLDLVQDMPYWSRLMAGVRSVAASQGRHLLLIDNIQSFTEWEKIDAAVLFIGIVNSAERAGEGEMHANALTESQREKNGASYSIRRGLPCIAMVEPVAGMPSVTADDSQGTYLLTRHLIGLGHRRIAYLAEPDEGYRVLQHRREGYLRAMRESGIEVETGWLRELRVEDRTRVPDWYKRAGLTDVKNWLEGDWRELGCTALMTQNDNVAIGAISAFQAAGLSVPGAVSVTGFDATYSEFRPGLTTVDIPLFEIGQAAVSMLSAHLDNASQLGESSCLPVRLVEGESCATPAA